MGHSFLDLSKSLIKFLLDSVARSESTLHPSPTILWGWPEFVETDMLPSKGTTIVTIHLYIR